MTIPPEYYAWREALGFEEISFGCSGVRLFPLAELDDGQIGYSHSQEGQSFCDGAEGSWKPEWIAIGYDTGLGDPFILDTSSPTLCIMTAMHGEGAWEPYPIARSLEAFAATLRTLKEISVGREYPVALENNPLLAAEKDRVLQLIRSANDDEVDVDFWEALLGV